MLSGLQFSYASHFLALHGIEPECVSKPAIETRPKKRTRGRRRWIRRSSPATSLVQSMPSQCFVSREHEKREYDRDQRFGRDESRSIFHWA